MAVTLEQIKELREETGVSMMACKKALEESQGDTEKAIDILRKKGEAKASERKERQTMQGVIDSYIHGNSRIGVLIHVGCETDFVAKNEDFKQLARNLAMHIAAMSPKTTSPEDVPDELVGKERDIWKDQLRNEGKPENMIENIMNGKEKKFREENALLTQQFVKNPDITVAQLITDFQTKLGENIQIVKFERYSI